MTWIFSCHVMIFLLFSLFPGPSGVSLSIIDTFIFFTNSLLVFFITAACVVDLPIGKLPKGLVVRSRCPLGNRALCVIFFSHEYENTPNKALTLPLYLGLANDHAPKTSPKCGKLPRFFCVANSSSSLV